MKRNRFIYIKRKLFPMVFKLAIAVIVIFSIIIASNRRVTVLMHEHGMADARMIASNIANNAVKEVINKNPDILSSAVILQRDADNNIIAASVDSFTVNRLKSDIILKINEEIKRMESSEFYIPIGSIFSFGIFSGRGPSIPLKYVMAGSSEVFLTSLFTSEGINQTRYTETITTKIYLNIIMPDDTYELTVDDDVVIYDTLIVGNIPGVYAEIKG